MKRVLILLGALVLMSSPAFAAGGEKGEWEIGGFIGAGFPDTYDGYGLDRWGPLVGVRAGYFFTECLSLEPSFQWIFTEARGGQSVDLYALRLNVLWNFLPEYMIRPFVTAGLGLEMGSFPAVDTRDFGPNFGLGLHAYLWENWGLRFDGRWAPVHVNATPSVGTPINDGWQSNLEAAVGVFYAFGGAKDEEPAPAPAPEPEPEPGDQDGDGVNDEKDECPDTPRGATVDEKGCPSDSDGDGVFDGIDKCPDTPKGTEVDAMGCPKVSKARGVLQGVTFKFGSAELTDSAKVTLDEVAKTLNEFPNVKVEVQGHTDSTGPDAVNEHLSQKRAESVMEYLGTAGVAKERLRAKGYGETKPIADNATRDGRSQNRRVQLDWLDE